MKKAPLDSSQGSQSNLILHSLAKRATLCDNGILVKKQTDISESDDSASILSCISCSTGESLDVSESIKSIPYYDILSCKYEDTNDFDDPESRDIRVVFAQRVKKQLYPKSILLRIDDFQVGDPVGEIMKRSYVNSKPNKSFLVFINPHGGKGKAMKSFLTKAKPILDAAGAKIETIQTKYNKHAIEIMESLNYKKYDIIACASGDGIPYEVFNGIYNREDKVEVFNHLAVTQIPCGSGNAMARSCHGTCEPSFAALSMLKAHTVHLDLMALTQENKTTVSFLSQTMGIIADSDIDTEHLRFLGAARFDLGVAYRVFKRTQYPCELYVKYAARSKDELRECFEKNVDLVTDKMNEITEDTFKLKYDPNAPVPQDWEKVDPSLTNHLGIFYTGKMPYISKDVQFFPAALPNDGTIDLIMLDARTSITRQTPILLSLETGKHVNAPEILHSKVYAYRLKPRYEDGLFSIDGERYDSKEIQVEVLQGAAKTLLKNGTYVETNFYTLK